MNTAHDTQSEFVLECRQLVAATVIAATESLPLTKRVMLYHGLADLFPNDSPEATQARHVAESLASAESQQLRLTSILDGTVDNREAILDRLTLEAFPVPLERHEAGETLRSLADSVRSRGLYSPKSGLADIINSLRNRAARLGLIPPLTIEPHHSTQ